MAKVKNIAPGPRGIWSTTGLVMLDAGATQDIDLAAGEHAADFEIDGASTSEPGPLDLNLDDLTAHLANVTDADEVQALLDAEIAGKSRKGAVAALEARRDELLA